MGSLQGKRVTVAELYAAADALERAYAAAGYILARVVVPPQQLADGGTVRLQVVDGVIERVDVSAVPERERGVVSARMAGVVGERHVTLSEIERGLLLVGDLPGISLKSTLAQGTVPGGTLLVVEATQQLVTGSVGFDDRLPKSLGTWRHWPAPRRSTMPAGLGQEQACLCRIRRAPTIRACRGCGWWAAGVVLPVGSDGFTLNPEYTQSIARPMPAPGAPATIGDFRRLALRANYPLIRSREETLNLQASLEWDDETLTAVGFGTRLYQDEYGAGRVGAHDRAAFAPGRDRRIFDGSFSHQGSPGRDGTAALPLSQQGASPVFNKILGSATLRQPLPGAFELAAIGRGQTSFGTPLMLAEQFGLDGSDALSAFASGTFSVDEGATLRAELSHPFSLGPLGLMPPVGAVALCLRRGRARDRRPGDGGAEGDRRGGVGRGGREERRGREPRVA